MMSAQNDMMTQPQPEPEAETEMETAEQQSLSR